MKRALALVLFCEACGSGSGLPTHVTSSGGSVAFTGVEAFSVVRTMTVWSSAGPSSHWVEVDVIVTASPGACARVAARTSKAGTTDLAISVAHGTADPIPAGTYPIGFGSLGDPTPIASISMGTTDGSCQALTWRHATSGTVTLSRIATDEISGSIDVTLDDGSKAVGPFSAPHCVAAEGPPSLDPPWTCVP